MNLQVQRPLIRNLTEVRHTGANSQETMRFLQTTNQKGQESTNQQSHRINESRISYSVRNESCQEDPSRQTEHGQAGFGGTHHVQHLADTRSFS